MHSSNSITDEKMTLREILLYGENQIKTAGISDYKTDAWLLIEYVFGINKSQYFMHMGDAADEEKKNQYFLYVKMRCSHIPLQHITHSQEFMGYKFYVNENVLIPRQDTETLIEKVENILAGIRSKTEHSGGSQSDKEIRILDMCTGSGCIAISLKKRNADCHVAAVDISKDAIIVANKNANNLQAEIEFIESDLFEKIDESMEKFDVIVSNPPYIRHEELLTLETEVKDHEPVIALEAKENGLYFYRKISEEAYRYLKPQGFVAFEIGYDQGKAVKALLEKNNFYEIKVYKDLAGLNRVVVARLDAL